MLTKQDLQNIDNLISNNKVINQRFEQMDRRFDKMHERFDRLTNTLEDFQEQNAKDHEYFREQFEEVFEKLSYIITKLENHSHRILNLESMIEKVKNYLFPFGVKL